MAARCFLSLLLKARLAVAENDCARFTRAQSFAIRFDERGAWSALAEFKAYFFLAAFFLAFFFAFAMLALQLSG